MNQRELKVKMLLNLNFYIKISINYYSQIVKIILVIYTRTFKSAFLLLVLGVLSFFYKYRDTNRGNSLEYINYKLITESFWYNLY